MIQMIMPKMGESVAEATILKWLKKEGDKIEADEAVLEIATDKVDSEVPSPSAGILSKRMFEEGQVVKVGEVIALITAENETTANVPAVVTVPSASAHSIPSSNGKSEKLSSLLSSAATASSHTSKSSSDKFYSPLVRNIAKQEGISFSELDTLKGSGMNDRVTKNDLLQHIEKRKSGSAIPSQPFIQQQPATMSSAPAVSISGNVEIIEMDRMRKLIADHMVMSKHTSPHVTSFVEADVTNLVKWRDKVKDTFEKREKEKITFTPIFIEAVVKAIKDFPMINVSVDGTRIIVRKTSTSGWPLHCRQET